MVLKDWNELPVEMQTEEVRKYYEILKKKKFSLIIKRVFDVVVSSVLLLVLFPFFIILAIIIKLNSKGPVFYRQVRVTQYCEKFRIFKFRTMVCDADKSLKLTVDDDKRILHSGRIMRKYRIDELSQLIDVLRGKMTFVGTRPEVPEYVEKYTPEMMATLLLPAGITSEASIYYKDESKLLRASDDPEKTYIDVVLPDKMKYNLKAIEKFSFINDIKVIIYTVISVFK